MMQKSAYPVTGMSCAACAVSVESMVKDLRGVSQASVNYAGQELRVEYDPELTGPVEFQRSLRAIGYDLIVSSGKEKELQEEYLKTRFSLLKRNTLGAFILSLPVFILSMFFHHSFAGENWLLMLLTAPVIIIFGRQFFITGFKQTLHLKANMDTLVAMSTGIAFLFSLWNTIYPRFFESRGLEAQVYYESAAVIITFILFGKMLEEKAKSKTSSALKKLIGLQPKNIRRIAKDGTEEEIQLEYVLPDDMILIRPGEKIPVDGIVLEGNSFIDESMITGEPVPSEKSKDQEVFAGTLNQQGILQIQARKIGSESLLGQIIQKVQEAQGSKAPVQRLADRIAAIFVPAVLVIAILTFLSWLMIGGSIQLTHAFLSLVSVLIIACPCALGLATPTAIMVGIGKAAREGVLIRDAESLEIALKIDTIVLDKTGTITEGKPVVTGIYWQNAEDRILLQPVLKALEGRSEHPLARAVLNYLDCIKNPEVKIEEFENLPGKGLRAKIEGQSYLVGNEKLLDEYGSSLGESGIKDLEVKSGGKTVVYFAGMDRVYCLIAIADQVKESSVTAIRDLRKEGIEVYMLTGDNAVTATAVARETGIDNFQSGMMPMGKGNFIKKLQGEGKIVAMVGDGINDSHALAQADVGIAMGKGSDIAMESARMVIMRSDLRQVLTAIHLSKRTLRTIRQNLFWAFFYNIIAIPVAAGLLYPFTGFLLNPMIAGAAMALSSVSVVSNSLRLR